MKFNLYDLLSKLIPGGILLSILLIGKWIELPDEVPEIAYLFFAYFIGFIIDAIGFNLQYGKYKLLWKLFGLKNKPAESILLASSKFGRVYSHIDDFEKHFKESWDNKSKVFGIAFQSTMNLENTRIQSFNEHWFGARNFFIAFLIGLPFLIFHVWLSDFHGSETKKIIFITLSFCVLFVLYKRMKSRQYLLVKEVLDTYWRNFINKK